MNNGNSNKGLRTGICSQASECSGRLTNEIIKQKNKRISTDINKMLPSLTCRVQTTNLNTRSLAMTKMSPRNIMQDSLSTENNFNNAIDLENNNIKSKLRIYTRFSVTK